MNVLNSVQWPIKGLCHVGAYTGKEVIDYYKRGVKFVVWIEPNYFIFNNLIKNTSDFKIKNIYLPLLLSDVDEKVEFFLTNNGESSSFMKFGYDMYPEIKVVNTISLMTTRFDTYEKKQTDFSWNDINVLIVDCQGADLKVLKGFGNLLHSSNLKMVKVEVNFVEIYKDTPTEEEINEYLVQFGFIKKFWFVVDDKSWGETTWIRKELY